jgi:hypothetical protein
MEISILRPISEAFDRTRKILFQPFEPVKWLTLGFCVWLANLASGGSGGGGFHGGSGPRRENYSQASHWFVNNVPLIILLASIAIVLFVAIMVLLNWLSSRGKFMFLDGVVRNRGAVKKPWKEYRAEGNSAFIFFLVLFLVSFMGVVVMLIGGLATAWPDLQEGVFGQRIVTALVLLAITLLPWMILFGIVRALTRDFVLPIMYLRRIGVCPAWRASVNEFLLPHLLPVIGFYIVKFFLGIAIGLTVVCLVLLTCCIAAIPLMIPYIGTVLLLPIYIFWRCYSLCFLRQAGAELDVFAPREMQSEGNHSIY